MKEAFRKECLFWLWGIFDAGTLWGVALSGGDENPCLTLLHFFPIMAWQKRAESRSGSADVRLKPALLSVIN
jgi:hypothetical protein